MAMNVRISQAAKRFNPRVLAFARKVPPWVVLEHTGRKSGKPFQTPLTAFATRDPESLGVLVAFPLPWGPDTDWCRNVLHAEKCAITRRGVRYTVTEPHVVSADEAVSLGVRLAAVVAPLGIDRKYLVGTLHATSKPEL